MRNRDTSKATAARVRAKHERWIKELTEAGYFVANRALGVRMIQTPGVATYATNGLHETYEVLGWEQALDSPILRGADGKHFLGTQNYLFTAGPR